MIFIFLNLFFLIYMKVSLGDQLYHREGRFIDLSIHRYKTQLPSIHDIANSFIHYRIPVAVFVPTVRLNIKSKQKRTHFSTFSSTPKKQDNQSNLQSKIPTVNNQPTQLKSAHNKPEIDSTQTIISRNGWTVRLLSKPKSFNSLSPYKSRSINQSYKKSNLNYASQTPSESNIDLIPFLYKDNLPVQTSNLLNSQYKLSNTNPSHTFNQNIAYIQPNSLVPFQPNILLLAAPEQTVFNKLRNQNRTNTFEKQKNNTIADANNIVTTTQPDELINKKTNLNGLESNSTILDISEINNPNEIVQNNEPIENIPLHPVKELSSDVDNVANGTLNNDQINNSTVLISNDSHNLENQLDTQSISQPVLGQPNELRTGNIINELLTDSTLYRSNRLNRSNLVNQLYLPPSSLSIGNMIRPKNIITNRTQRSPSIDMPSYASLITAAVAQAGHSREDRKMLFSRFLDDNSN